MFAFEKEVREPHGRVGRKFRTMELEIPFVRYKTREALSPKVDRGDG